MPSARKHFFYQDYWHRVFTVDFYIAYWFWAKQHDFEILFFDYYFEGVGGNRNIKKHGVLRSKTCFKTDDNHYIEPDGSSIFIGPEKMHLFLLEVYNGKDTKRITNQLFKQCEAISKGLPTEKYQEEWRFTGSNRVICVFEYESTMKAVQKRMRLYGDFAGFEKHFLFSTVDKMQALDFERWQLFTGSTVNFMGQSPNSENNRSESPQDEEIVGGGVGKPTSDEKNVVESHTDALSENESQD